MQISSAQILAAQSALHSQKSQRLAAEVVGMVQGILAGAQTSDVAAVAQALQPGLPAFAAMERLRDQISQVAVLVGRLPAGHDAALKTVQPALDAADKRCAAIQSEIAALNRKLNGQILDVMRPADLWATYVAKGLSREQILKHGIPYPEVSTKEEAAPVLAKLHADHDGAVGKLIAERDAIRRWQKTLAADVPEAVRQHWTSPKGLAEAMEGLL